MADDSFKPTTRHSEIQCDMEEGTDSPPKPLFPKRSETQKMVEEAKRDHCAWMMCFVIILLTIAIALVIYMIATNEPDTVVINRIEPDYSNTNSTEPIAVIEEPVMEEDPSDDTPENPVLTPTEEVTTPEEETTPVTPVVEPVDPIVEPVTPETPVEPEGPSEPQVVIATDNTGEFVGEVQIGNMDRPYQAMWPTPTILKSLDVNSDWRISSVKYKAYRDQFNLCAIQFVFDNGIASPWCQA